MRVLDDWLKTFNTLSPRYDSSTLFRDWCHCYAIAIANTVTLEHTPLWEAREKQYLEIVKRYDNKDVQVFPTLCDLLVQAFNRYPFEDYLGSLYMELFGGNKQLGQCFTPMSLYKPCAKVSVQPREGEVQTLADECSGGGAMLIAACEVYQDAGIDYQRWLKITAGDLDKLCVHMTYIQLSLIGARATVFHHDALSREHFDTFVTPMEILWPLKYPVKNTTTPPTQPTQSTPHQSLPHQRTLFD